MDVTAKAHPVRVAERLDFEIPKIDGSRFVATLIPAESEAVVLEAQLELRATHPHCRHVCFAYVGASQLEVRFSDDGEPGKTAGYPMLRALLGASVRNSAALVTRYFGGVKLGTGGLVRAYTSAVREALLRVKLEAIVATEVVALSCCYSAEPRLRHQLEKWGIGGFTVEYGADRARFRVRCPQQVLPDLRTALGVRAGGDIEEG